MLFKLFLPISTFLMWLLENLKYLCGLYHISIGHHWSRDFFEVFIHLSSLHTQCGARTLNPEIKSFMLLWLCQPGAPSLEIFNVELMWQSHAVRFRTSWNPLNICVKSCVRGCALVIYCCVMNDPKFNSLKNIYYHKVCVSGIQVWLSWCCIHLRAESTERGSVSTHVAVGRPQFLASDWPETLVFCHVTLSTVQLTRWQLASSEWVSYRARDWTSKMEATVFYYCYYCGKIYIRKP